MKWNWRSRLLREKQRMCCTAQLQKFRKLLNRYRLQKLRLHEQQQAQPKRNQNLLLMPCVGNAQKALFHALMMVHRRFKNELASAAIQNVSWSIDGGAKPADLNESRHNRKFSTDCKMIKQKQTSCHMFPNEMKQTQRNHLSKVPDAPHRMLRQYWSHAHQSNQTKSTTIKHKHVIHTLFTKPTHTSGKTSQRTFQTRSTEYSEQRTELMRQHRTTPLRHAR